VGKKHLITADMVQPGALVIDVGINVQKKMAENSQEIVIQTISQL
jgi:5,10-methylene-tetrahydrofolate dehydrogenase/methenyl tetrahydrofolate cyclohydrolase